MFELEVDVSRETSKEWALAGSADAPRIPVGRGPDLAKDLVGRAMADTILQVKSQLSEGRRVPTARLVIVGWFRDDQEATEGQESDRALSGDGRGTEGPRRHQREGAVEEVVSRELFRAPRQDATLIG